MKREAKFDKYDAALRAAARGANGLAGLTGDGAGGLRVYWRGEVPAEVLSVIEAARVESVDIDVRPSPYTETELKAEADRISKLPLFSGAKTGQRAMRVNARPDGKGIDVALAGLPSGMSDAQMKLAVPALISAYPVTLSAMEMPIFSTRFFDSPPPFYGGAFMVSPARGNSCTTGFGVRGNNGAATYLITAAHCGEGVWHSGKIQFPDGTSRFMTFGSTIVAGRNTGLDVGLIYTPEGAGAGVYWGNSINPPNNDPGAFQYVNVSAAGINRPESRICQSGSFSGTQCGATVMSLGVTVSYDPPVNGVSRVTNLVWASNLQDGSAFVGQGDSGGPVTGFASNGRVVALGIVSGQGGDDRACKGWAAPGRRCSQNIYYADLQGAMSAVGVQINTA